MSELLYPEAVLGEATIDTKQNRLILTYTPSTADAMKSEEDVLSSRLGVPLSVESGRLPTHLEACGQGSTRANCWSPIKAGVRTFKDYVGNTTKQCTMGFHIYKESDSKKNQWLTAGHCVYPGTQGSTPVYHSAGFHSGSEVGVLEATLYTAATDPRDIARVTQKFAGEAHDRIYGHPASLVTGYSANLIVDEIIKFSGAGSDAVVAGTVKSVSKCWLSEARGVTVCGAQAQNMVSIPGDSGAPVYRQYDFAGTNYIAPLGIVNDNTSSGMVFAKLGYAFSKWTGWEVRGLAAP